jgi:hypothetical protein
MIIPSEYYNNKIEEEIERMKEGVNVAYSGTADEMRKYGIPFMRILVREQAILTELKRGMKGSK